MASARSVTVRGFTSELAPPETPFTRPGRDERGYRFLYMSARQSGRWTLLLDPARGAPILEDAERLIPHGRTQIWVFEKRYAAPPPPANVVAMATAPRDLVRDPRRGTLPRGWPTLAYPDDLDRRDWPGRLFVTLRQPRAPTRNPDVLGYHTSEDAATQMADEYRAKTGRRTVVGLLRADIGWY